MNSKEAYLQKLRNMGILREQKDMPEYRPRPEIGRYTNPGREGFAPAYSQKASQLYKRKHKGSSPETDIEEQFKGVPFDPETYKKLEDAVGRDIIEHEEMSEEQKIKYIDALIKRMKTS